MTKNLDEANANKEELEEKIRLLTLSSEEKQVDRATNSNKYWSERISNTFVKASDFLYNIDSLFLTFQRAISDLEGKVYNANYNQKYLQENVQDLQAKIDEER